MAIQLSKNGNAVKFDFDDNSHYLNDGTIEVPVNSLTLVTDESDMFTFKKAASDDIFISGLYSEIGMSKAELIAWYKDNMVGSTGGGGGVTSGEVQTMIDESISGKADTSDVQEIASDVATVSGDVSTLSGAVDSNHNAITALNGDVSSLSGDVANKADTTAVTASINAAVSGKMDTSAFNTYSASTDARISEDEEVTSAALNALDDALDDKADTSAVTASIAAAVSGKQDTLIAGTNITISGNVISAEGGGKAISAGTNISVTTGATADTINCTLPFIIKSNGIAYNNTYGNIVIGNYNFNGANSIFTRGDNSGSSINTDIICAGGSNKFTGAATRMLIAGSSNQISNSSEGYSSAGGNGIIVGQYNKINHSRHNYVFGDSNSGGTSVQQELNNYLLIFGEKNKTNNTYESTFGRFNNSVSGSSTFGDSGNTLFSVGNGTAENARHNAFEIRQNGDIYITSGGTDIKLQDNLGGGGLPESAFTAYTASTDARLAEDEEVTAASLNALNDAIDDKADASDLGGLKLVQLTQAQYDALTTKDSSTLYIITSSN